MGPDLKTRLLSLDTTLTNWKLYGINPINSERLEMRRLYVDLGHPQPGTCGQCDVDVYTALYEHLLDAKQ